MISEVDEDFGVGIGLKNLTISTSDFSSLALDNGEEVFWGDILTSVIDVAASIHILSVWLVEDFAWEWVLGVVCDIIIGEGDDLIFGDSVFLHNLIGVADIGLMSVVAVGVGTSYEDGPMVSGSTRGNAQ